MAEDGQAPSKSRGPGAAIHKEHENRVEYARETSINSR
jgi:hypothetical protein